VSGIQTEVLGVKPEVEYFCSCDCVTPLECFVFARAVHVKVFTLNDSCLCSSNQSIHVLHYSKLFSHRTRENFKCHGHAELHFVMHFIMGKCNSDHATLRSICSH